MATNLFGDKIMFKTKLLLLTLASSLLLNACVTVGQVRTRFKGPSRSERLQNEARTKTQLAIEYMNIRDYRAATATIEEALKADENYDMAWLSRAQIYQVLKVNDKAEESFHRALAISPNGAEINNNYGWFLCSSKNNPAASIAYFDKALSDPTYPSPEISYLNKGICTAKIGQYRQADDFFENNNLRAADREFRLYQSRVQMLSADDLLLGWKISRADGEMQAASEYEAQLRTNYPYSDELKSITGHNE